MANNKDKKQRTQYRHISQDEIGFYPVNKKYKWTQRKNKVKNFKIF